MADSPMTPVTPPEQKGYGKRPLWQWIMLYVLIGAVVYGLVYYFAFAKDGDAETNGDTEQSSGFPY